MIAYIDANRDRYGVEPICRVLPIAPSTYHAAHRRPASARAVRDRRLKAEISRRTGVPGNDRLQRLSPLLLEPEQSHLAGTVVA